MKTVWIYVDPNKRARGVEHLKVFADTIAADRWFKENNPEGVAFRYEVLDRLKAGLGLTRQKKRDRNGKMAKTRVSNGVLTTIFWQKMRKCPQCPKRSIPIAIVPVGRSGWKALTVPKVARSYPLCAKHVEKVQKELQKIYALDKD